MKTRDISKIVGLAALVATFAFNTNVKASGYLEDSEPMGTRTVVAENVETFDNGVSITTLSGKYNEIMPRYQHLKFNSIIDRRLISTIVRYDVDNNQAEAIILTVPKGKVFTNPDKNITLFGNLDKMEEIMSLKLSNGWKTVYYEGWGTIQEPKGEAMLTYQF